MGRSWRASAGGYVYHVLNRANGLLPLFQNEGDFSAFERVLTEAHELHKVPILAYCVMPNHWHLVLWPRGDGDLSRFMGWLTLTHTQRWHAHHHSVGTGHVCQGRFKSFPIQEDEHVLTACHYVERNALRARLVRRAENWRWCSLWRRERGNPEEQALLSTWPVPRPRNWTERVNAVQNEAVLAAVRRCVARSSPFGEETWVKAAVAKLGLEVTQRPRGRPKRSPEPDNKGS